MSLSAGLSSSSSNRKGLVRCRDILIRLGDRERYEMATRDTGEALRRGDGGEGLVTILARHI